MEALLQLERNWRQDLRTFNEQSDQLMRSKHKVQMDRAEVRKTKAELIYQKQQIERRMRRFRKVVELAWDVVIGEPDREKILALRDALSLADHLWEGYAGCHPPISVEEMTEEMARIKALKAQAKIEAVAKLKAQKAREIEALMKARYC